MEFYTAVNEDYKQAEEAKEKGVEVAYGVVAELAVLLGLFKLPCIEIGALGNLFEVKLQPLRNLIANPDSSWKSRKLIKEWFIQQNVTYDQEIFQVWSAINTLRNSTFPYHSGDARAVGAIRFFGLNFPPDIAVSGKISF